MLRWATGTVWALCWFARFPVGTVPFELTVIFRLACLGECSVGIAFPSPLNCGNGEEITAATTEWSAAAGLPTPRYLIQVGGLGGMITPVATTNYDNSLRSSCR